MVEGLRVLFQIGKKYTIYKVNSFCLTSKSEIKIIRFMDGNPVFKMRGKQKELLMPLETRSYQFAQPKPFDGAVFEGWDQPIKCDSELYFNRQSSTMFGNACLNFVAPVSQVREWFETKQLNPCFNKKKVCAVAKVSTKNIVDNVVAVFPEEAQVCPT